MLSIYTLNVFRPLSVVDQTVLKCSDHKPSSSLSKGEHSDLYSGCEGFMWSQAEGDGEVRSYVSFHINNPICSTTFVYFMALGEADPCAFSLLSPALRMAFLLLLLISATWMLGLMAVNSDVMTFHYLFAIFSCLQVTQRLCYWQNQK